MSQAGTDLIAGYLAELRAGLWIPAAEAELIMAEAEDHLRETAETGMEIGMTELEAQEAAISSFGPVRAVTRAHRRRIVTAVDAVMAAWKVAGLLAAIVGVGGLAATFVLNTPSGVVPAFRTVQNGSGVCQCSMSMVPAPIAGPDVMALTYAAVAAGGLALLAARLLAARRLTPRGTLGRDPLGPAVTASFFLLITALMLALNVSGVGGATFPSISWNTPISSGLVTTTVPLIPGAIIAACLAVAVGYGVQAARRLAGCWPVSGAPAWPGQDPVFPAVMTGFFLLVSALLFALNVTGVGAVTNQAAWVAIPLSTGSTTTTIPVVPGVIVAACLAVAVGYGIQTARRLARRGPGSAVLALVRSGSG